MSVDACQTAQEPTCGHFWDNHEQDTTSDGAGPEIGPEGPMESLAGLRAYVKRHARMDEMTKAALQVYAREIEREVGEMQRALTIDAKPMTDENMAESGWIRLPLDADGVPIHVGDVMEWPDTSTAEVVGIGDDRFFYAEDGLRYAWASDKIHYHAPTVEDVLRKFAEGLGVPVADSYVAATAAKLRLAEEVE